MNLVVTISRRYGTGASVIAAKLSEKLNIPVYDKAYIEGEAGCSDYAAEAQAIHRLAAEPCIILGRCASEILKDQKNVFNIYVSAENADRVKRIMEQTGKTAEEVSRLLEEADRERADYYYQFTGKHWGDVNNYHMILDTSRLGVENCADILLRYFEQKEYI